MTVAYGASSVVNANIALASGAPFLTSMSAHLAAANPHSQYALTTSFVNSLANPGYQKLPGGLIMQWGTTGSLALDSTANSVSFPIAFPTACLNVQATASTNNGVSVGSTNYACGIYSKSTSGFLLNNDSTAGTFDWHAIGY